MNDTTQDSSQLILALSKGRIFEDTLPLLAAAGIEVLENPETSRKLILATNDPVVLSNFARTVLIAPDLNYRDLELALQAAEAANRGSKGQDPSILNTYALALFKNGKGAQALELSKKALALAKDERMTRDLEKSLNLYQQADTAAPLE